MISKKLALSFIFILLFANVKAQVNGIVFDQISRKPIVQVEVSNLNNQEKTVSDDKGEFNIKSKINELLVFRRPGYRSDTLLLTNLKPLRRYMYLDKNVLSTVTILGKRSIREEYAQAFNKANPFLLQQGRGLLFYPSSYFSREGRQARRFVRMLKREELEKIIDRRFNLKSIRTLLPIEQPELDAFFVLYRPSLKFAKRVNADDLKSYVLDCYRKFKLLPPEQRILPSLKGVQLIK